MRRLTPALTALVLSVASCSDPTSVSGGVSAVNSGGAMRLTNASATPVYYFLVERGTAATINWAPCVNPGCPAIPPNATVTVPDGQILGVQPGSREVVFYWWRSQLGPADGSIPGAVQGMVVPL